MTNDTHTRRVAVIGSKEFDVGVLAAFLINLQRKYPSAVVVTGNGIGAEAAVKRGCDWLGIECVVPERHKEVWGKDATDLQVFTVCRGAWDGLPPYDLPEQAEPMSPDVLVIVGDPKASRPSAAREWWERIHGQWRKGFFWGYPMDNSRPTHVVAQVKKAAKPKKRAVSKKQREAREAA